TNRLTGPLRMRKWPGSSTSSTPARLVERWCHASSTSAGSGPVSSSPGASTSSSSASSGPSMGSPSSSSLSSSVARPVPSGELLQGLDDPETGVVVGQQLPGQRVEVPSGFERLGHLERAGGVHHEPVDVAPPLDGDHEAVVVRHPD